VGLEVAEGKCWESGRKSRGPPSMESESCIFVSLVLRCMMAFRWGLGAMFVGERGPGEWTFGVRLEGMQRFGVVNCTRSISITFFNAV